MRIPTCQPRNPLHFASVALPLSAVFVGLLVSGCASMMAGGGRMAGRKTEPTILVNYRVEGPAPDGATYHLVQTERGPCMWERSSDGSGFFFETHWADQNADHYAGWIKGSTKHSNAYEFVIPRDRAAEARKYVYLAGTFSVMTIDGLKRPVPVDPEVKLTVRLVPVSEQQASSAQTTPANPPSWVEFSSANFAADVPWNWGTYVDSAKDAMFIAGADEPKDAFAEDASFTRYELKTNQTVDDWLAKRAYKGAEVIETRSVTLPCGPAHKTVTRTRRKPLVRSEIFVVPQGGHVWVIKLSGAEDRYDQYRTAFDRIRDSFRPR